MADTLAPLFAPDPPAADLWGKVAYLRGMADAMDAIGCPLTARHYRTKAADAEYEARVVEGMAGGAEQKLTTSP